MKHTIPVVKASHIQPFISALLSIKAPVEELLSQCQLSLTQFDDGENLVAEKNIWHFVEVAALYSKRNDFGFWVTKQFTLDKYGAFGEGIMCENTLFSALNKFINTMGSQSNCPTFWLQESQETIWFCRQGLTNFHHGQWPVEQHVIAFMIELARLYLGKEWSPKKVKFQSSTTEGCGKQDYFKQSQLFIQQSYTAIAIDKSVINEKVKDNQYYLRNLKLRQIPNSNAEKIKQLFTQYYFGNTPTMEEVSKHLDIHPRTLQRMLKKEQTSFRDLLEVDKFNRAKRLMIHSTIPLTIVSAELGFTNSANFTRAFKRWSGMTPRAFKQQYATTMHMV